MNWKKVGIVVFLILVCVFIVSCNTSVGNDARSAWNLIKNFFTFRWINTQDQLVLARITFIILLIYLLRQGAKIGLKLDDRISWVISILIAIIGVSQIKDATLMKIVSALGWAAAALPIAAIVIAGVQLTLIIEEKFKDKTWYIRLLQLLILLATLYLMYAYGKYWI